jgi:hypothetical protein
LGRSFGPRPFCHARLRPMASRGGPARWVPVVARRPVTEEGIQWGLVGGLSSGKVRGWRRTWRGGRRLNGEVAENGGVVESFDGGRPATVTGDRGGVPAARGEGGGEVHMRNWGHDARGGTTHRMRRTAATLGPEIQRGGDSSVPALDEMQRGGRRVSRECEERGKRGAGKRGGGGNRGALKGARQLALWIGMEGSRVLALWRPLVERRSWGSGVASRRSANNSPWPADAGRRQTASAHVARSREKKGVRLGTLRVGRYGLVQNEQ